MSESPLSPLPTPETPLPINGAAPAAPAGSPAAAPSQIDPNSLRDAFENGDYPYETRMGRRSYETQKAHLQAELLKVQLWAQETGQKFVLIFEGRDAGTRPVVFSALCPTPAHLGGNGAL